jgi:hypothetical protein
VSVISGPIPAYQNLPIDAEFYSPSRFNIASISLGRTTIVTATEDMNYVVGQLTRLLIQPLNGSRQLNQKESFVISIPSSDSVELDLDSSIGVDSFLTTSTGTQPQIVPVGDVNSGIISSTGRIIPTTNIPGSFINVS